MSKPLMAFLIVMSSSGVLAELPVECTNPDEVGCSFESDLLVFAEGDPTYELFARLNDCYSCTNHQPDGSFTFRGRFTVEFGPYSASAPPPCSVVDGRLWLEFNFDLIVPLPESGGVIPGYVPVNSTQVFVPDQSVDLVTTCARSGELEYHIPRVYLTEGQGARSADSSQPSEQGYEAFLKLPDTVRAATATGLTDQLSLDHFRFPQNLAVYTTETQGSAVRLWPDGLPFRLDPSSIDFEPEMAAVSLGGSSYEWHPPDQSGLNPSTVVQCSDPACETTNAVHNAGYLADPMWVPSDVFFDESGMSLSLGLAVGESVTFETAFPRGTVVTLAAPASLTVSAGVLDGGSFGAGDVLMEKELVIGCDQEDWLRRHAFRDGDIQIQSGGGLLAGVEDLNDNLSQPSNSSILWARNAVNNLGCGTFYAPPPQLDPDPVQGWYQSAVPTVIDRGIYAGVNYNRNRVCKPSDGPPSPKTCTVDSDCDTGAGETCVDGGFSPLCPAFPAGAPVPQWTTQIEGTPLVFGIDPDQAGQGDREMALVMRRSGVTGVFDAGDDDFPFSTMNGFAFDFDVFGLAYRASRSEGADTIVAGKIDFIWPIDTSLPFVEMSVCDCGALDAPLAPDHLIERELRYWNQQIFPFGLRFKDNTSTCAAWSGCNGGSQSDVLCVQALTPIPRFEPDPESWVELLPTGEIGTATPYSHAQLIFDEDKIGQTPEEKHAGYVYHIEDFQFSSWWAAGKPDPGEGWGYRSTRGDVELPFFGLTPAAVKIQRLGGLDLADMGAECDETATPLCSTTTANDSFPASRLMAGDTVPIDFQVDYITPGNTTDTEDGNDSPHDGHGSLFAYADCVSADCQIDLGATQVGAAMRMRAGEILDDEGEIGPAAAMRLYASVIDDSALDGILDPTRRSGAAGIYDAALDRLGRTNQEGHLLPPPSLLEDELHATDAIAELIDHPDAMATFNVDPIPTEESPPMEGTKTTGYMLFDADTLDYFLVSSNINTGGEFFALDASLLTVDRHVMENEEPVTLFTRRPRPGSSNNMQLPGEQDVPFPAESQAKSEIGYENEFMTWVFDYAPGFEFQSLTGSADLTKAGFSGVGIDQMGMTLKFWNDGDWFFTAGMDGNFDGYRVQGDVLFGNTGTMEPIQDIDPEVAAFLEGITEFDGAFVTVGAAANIWDNGCFLRFNGAMKVGGWYISDYFGGRINGAVTGEAICLVSLKGSLTLMGMTDFDIYKVGGNFWLAGGAGLCDEEDWDYPDDVLDDDWCAACVVTVGMTGHFPPEDLDIQISGPDIECALP